MNHRLEELLDLPKLQDLLDSLYSISGIPSAIIDVQSNVLTATAWQDICTKFHRTHPETRQKCLESDAYIVGKLSDRPSYVIYKCPNGLVDTAIPIIVDNEHIGNVFTGQFFLEEPDIEFFRDQAWKYGFNEDGYLDALRRVPIISRKTLEKNLEFLDRFTELLAEQGIKKLFQIQAREALAEHDEFLNNIIESIRDGIIILDRDFNIIRTNQATETLYPAKVPLRGKKCYQAYHDRSGPCENCPYIRTLKNCNPDTEIIAYAEANGEKRWREIYTFPMLDKKTDELTGVIEYVRDVTDRKRIEDELTSERSQLFSIFNSIDEVVYVTDPHTHEILFINKALESLFGDVAGQECYRAFQGLDSPCPFCTNDKIFGKNEGKSYIWEFRNRLNNRWYRCIDKAIRWPDGRQVRYEMAIDITDLKEGEKDRERLNAELKRKNRELEQFLYIASHDLRSPLVNIGGYVEEMSYSIRKILSYIYEVSIVSGVKKQIYSVVEEDIPQAEYLISKNVSRMASMLSGLLKISRLGQVVLRKERIDMNALIPDVLAPFHFRIRKAGVKIRVADLPFCTGDASLIRQIVPHLLDNALKFLSPHRPGLIIISGSIKGCESVYCVEDNGIGVKQEYQDKIFNLFYTLRTAEDQGAGAGLAITKKILERHDGRMWIESEPDRGSKFYFSIPE